DRDKQWVSTRRWHGAIEQWKFALEAERRIQDLDPSFPSSPSLSLQLAKAYRETGKWDDATTKFLDAAKQLAYRDPENARQALQDVTALKTNHQEVVWSDARNQRFQLVTRALEHPVEAKEFPAAPFIDEVTFGAFALGKLPPEPTSADLLFLTLA